MPNMTLTTNILIYIYNNYVACALRPMYHIIICLASKFAVNIMNTNVGYVTYIGDTVYRLHALHV